MYINCNPARKVIHNTMIIRYDDSFDDDSILHFFINLQSDPARRQVQLCHNLIVNLFQKRNSPCKEKFPEVKFKCQIFDHYLSGISNITSHIYYCNSTTTIIKSSTTPNTNRCYRILFLESVYRVSENYSTSKTHKEQVQFC